RRDGLLHGTVPHRPGGTILAEGRAEEPVVMILRTFAGSLLSMALMIPLGGCVTATVQEIREADTGMEPHESIAVLGRRTLPSNAETEFGFVDCVSRNMRSGGNGVRVIHEDEFR